MTDSGLLSQKLQNQAPGGYGKNEISDDYRQLIRSSASEGIVMLKNDGVLPVKNEVMSVFGRVQHDYFYVGNGSGGDVRPPYLVNLLDGLENNSALNYNKELAKVYTDWCKENPAVTNAPWGKWPTYHEEMPITSELATRAKNCSDVAVVVIGRCAGEDRDSILEPGSFYLTKTEENMLDTVADVFGKFILLINSGNIIDFSWFEKYESNLSALLYVWQGGMESGNAICDVLCGNINPSGRLTTAIAGRYEDYPTVGNYGDKLFNNYAEDIFVGYRYFETFKKDAVLFPFGYGLGYTTFEMKPEGEISQVNGCVSLNVNVKNNGEVSGAEVVQVYYSAPQGVLGKPSRALAAFSKTTDLAPNAHQSINLQFPLYYMASYDDAGKTGHKSAYVLEPGEYGIYVGSSVRSAVRVGEVLIDELIVCAQHEEVAAVEPVNRFKRMTARVAVNGKPEMEDVPTRTVSLRERILANLPKEIKPTEYKGYKLSDVAAGKISLESFVAGLSMEELEGLTRGDYIMNSPLGSPGNAGVFGGVMKSLRDKGVIPITTTDGPSGIRLTARCALLPCGLALASTWNTKLITNLGIAYGEELTAKGSHVLLAPGMNILRDPLCGRNFEYFSEDPILSGKLAAAMVTGLQTYGKSACPKHYVANNQEDNRCYHDSRVSERALREIYLKGFEICIKDSKPRNLMTSYNKINGVWGHYHYELCTTVLRGEWGFEGNIVTDWWMRMSVDPDFPDVENNAYRVRAQVDVLMPGGISHGSPNGDDSLLESYSKEQGITLAEIQRSAMNTLRFVLHVLEG